MVVDFCFFLKLSSLGEDPPASQLGHILIKLVDEKGVVTPIILETSELLEPLVNSAVILVTLVDRTPLGIENNDSGEATVKQVKHILGQGCLDLGLNLLPESVVSQRREKHGDWEVCTENTDTEVITARGFAFVGHLGDESYPEELRVTLLCDILDSTVVVDQANLDDMIAEQTEATTELTVTTSLTMATSANVGTLSMRHK
ncbi:hypothetical protein HG530_014990 [Fusarium avenaceum]|nr:hypothetical protein HG530_014990 [Fusarium avenaceum]